MKRKLFQALALCLAGLCASAALFGCSRNNGGTDAEPLDTTRTQLYVFNYNGGVGTDWLRATKAAFEERYKEQSFQEGKKGVQIIIDAQKINGVSQITSVAASPNEVIFNEFIRYNDWVSQGKFLDISDIVTAVNEDGKTIQSKLNADQNAWLTVHGGKYYALPHYEVFRGVTYDMDLFESKKLYFADNTEYGDFILQAAQKKSKGPDGQYDTADDGMPATIVDFFKLLDHMVDSNVTPFVWTGKYPAYSLFLQYALLDTYAGAEEARLQYSFGVGSSNPTAKVVTGFSGGQPVTEDVTISEATGYNIPQTLAKYRAVELIYKMLSKSAYYLVDSTSNMTFSNLDAQQKFIFSKLENKPIAMLLDGTFWENEAKDAFKLSEEAFGDRAKNRRFGWMPMPAAYDDAELAQKGYGTQVLNDYVNAFCGINANINAAKIELAKLFVKFCYTDAGLNIFTKSTGMRKGLEYELTADTLAATTDFGRQLSQLRDEGTVISMHSTSELLLNFETDFTAYESVWGSNYAGQQYQYPVNAFKANAKDPITYFQGMRITPSEWTTRYGVIINK
ncbi:MAG: hypothetical protein LBS99_01465 [Clostridiales bacterium]|jgi:hypothetical protein|nr:hypothetical protein [Clostridiales bacterium]